MSGNSEAQEGVTCMFHYARMYHRIYSYLENITIVESKYPVRLLRYLQVELSNIDVMMPLSLIHVRRFK
jgi:hypothetical protein